MGWIPGQGTKIPHAWDLAQARLEDPSKLREEKVLVIHQIAPEPLPQLIPVPTWG